MGDIGRPVQESDLRVGLLVNLNATAIHLRETEDPSLTFARIPETRSLEVTGYNKNQYGWHVSLKHAKHPEWSLNSLHIDYLEVA